MTSVSIDRRTAPFDCGLAIGETDLLERTFPQDCPYRLTEILDDYFYPGEPTELLRKSERKNVIVLTIERSTGIGIEFYTRDLTIGIHSPKS